MSCFKQDSLKFQIVKSIYQRGPLIESEIADMVPAKSLASLVAHMRQRGELLLKKDGSYDVEPGIRRWLTKMFAITDVVPGRHVPEFKPLNAKHLIERSLNGERLRKDFHPVTFTGRAE
jgi:hypothetical protein